MKIEGIGSKEIFNLSNKKKIEKKSSVEDKRDTVEISSVGKSLCDYSSGETFGVSPEKLNIIRNQISSGTYNRDSKLVAQKMIDIMKGKDI